LVNALNIDYTANDARYLKKNGDTEAGVLTISNSTVSTTSTNGALVVSGGIGCNKSLTISGDLNMGISGTLVNC
jgi:hypothetical protein